tara:strand:+ start:95 stop:535 length:441 start_codon:yes stop_codon:yes gene_type:complete
MIKHRGGCHCGKVRFQAETDPITVHLCHCVRCQKLQGTVTIYVVFLEVVKFSGQLSEYVTTSDSGSPVRFSFCPNCGTNMKNTADGYPDTTAIFLSAFDDPTQFEPEWESFCELKPKWLRDSGCIKKSFNGGNSEEMWAYLVEKMD